LKHLQTRLYLTLLNLSRTEIEQEDAAPVKVPKKKKETKPKKKVPVWILEKSSKKKKTSTKSNKKAKEKKTKLTVQQILSNSLLSKKSSPLEHNKVVYNTKLNKSFQLKPLDEKSKKCITDFGSPVDIRELIEGTSVDGKRKTKKRHGVALHGTKSAPHVSLKGGAQNNSKTGLHATGRRSELCFSKLSNFKPPTSRKMTGECSSRMMVARDSSPEAQPAPKPTHGEYLHTRSVDANAIVSIKPKLNASKSVPHWSRPITQWNPNVRRNRKFTKKVKSSAVKEDVDLLSGAVDDSNLVKSSLSEGFSRMVTGILGKLSFKRTRNFDNIDSDASGDSTLESTI